MKPVCNGCSIKSNKQNKKYGHSDAGFKTYCHSDFMQKFFLKNPCPCIDCLIKNVCIDICEDYIIHREAHSKRMYELCCHHPLADRL